MNVLELEKFLFTRNSFEIQQHKTGKSINDIPTLSIETSHFFDSSAGYLRLPKDPFFLGSNVYIAKHNRFAPMAEHIHDFIEINYVYAGECTQSINREKITLPAGSVCILDRDVPHSIDPLNEKDVLINILINDQTFSSLFLFQLEKDKSLIANFLSAAFNKQTAHDNYIIFNCKRAPQIHQQIQLMLCENYKRDIMYSQFISQYLQLIISELMRIYRTNVAPEDFSKLNYVAILDYIDQHYQNLKLKDLKNHFNYSENYISNTLKKATGKNFQEVLLEKKLMVASDLLKESKLSIEKITEISGFNSTSYFHRQFKKRYRQTPKSMRNHR